MRNFFQQIGALFLTILVMTTTVSFTVDIHFCAGSIVDVSFAQEELSCSASLTGKLSDEAHNAMRNMGCCDDLQFQVEGQDELQISNLNVHVDYSDYVAENPLFLEYEGTLFTEDEVLYTSYIPPPLIQDIQVLHQTFLL